MDSCLIQSLRIKGKERGDIQERNLRLVDSMIENTIFSGLIGHV